MISEQTIQTSFSRTEAENNCILCEKRVYDKNMPQLIQRALYNRYCSSIGFYYLNDLNSLI